MTAGFDVTSVGINPAADRAHRMRVYFIAMTLRVVCVVSLFFVRGWWILLVAAGAVLLPYFAVIIANQAANTQGKSPDAPTPLELGPAAGAGETAAGESAAEMVIVIDAPAERRSAEGMS